MQLVPGTYPFAVAAQSQTVGGIADEAMATVVVVAQESVAVDWLPSSQTITDTLTASFMAIVTNTGNVATTYHFTLDAPSLTGDIAFEEVLIPPQSSVIIPVSVQAPMKGTYTVNLIADSTSSLASGEGSATLNVVETSYKAYLPVIEQP